MQVLPGDVIHADRHGALVIPPELVGETVILCPVRPWRRGA